MDEQFYTGLTSASATKVKEVKKDRKKDLSIKRNILLPAGELLNVEFEKEIDRIAHIDYVLLDKMTDGFEVKAELLAQKRAINVLRSIQQRLNNLLRDNKDE